MEAPWTEGREPGRGGGGGAQPHRGFKASRLAAAEESRIPLVKAAPLPFSGRGPRAAAPGLGPPRWRAGLGPPPDLGQPAAGRNGALCSPVEAPAVPELREEVATTQNKCLVTDVLSPAPPASFLAPKAHWKYGVAVYLGAREHLFSRISAGVLQPVKEITREMIMKEVLGKDTERRLCSPLRKSASAGTDPRKGYLAGKNKVQHFYRSLSTTLRITWAHLCTHS